MARALKGISVLVVEDDADTLDILALGLGAVGADVRTAASAEEALTMLEGWRPDVLLCDLQLPGVDGYRFLEVLRANPRLRTIPAAALSGVAGLPHEGRARATFEKFLRKPSKLPEIVIALATLCEHEKRPGAQTPERPSAELRSALAGLSTASGCRFTSLLRFAEDDTLTSIWTYDRDRPKIDPFPLGLPVHASYCVLVRDAGEMFVVEDATTDPRTADHSKRNDLARYIGVPLFRADGTMFGTVCCYDKEPHPISAETRDALAAAARKIEPWLGVLFSA
ncbi:MAG: response regulator [Deltaproteobacteria bacterium]|nr:response regulator [Deltaproteobacteria bacterium]